MYVSGGLPRCREVLDIVQSQSGQQDRCLCFNSEAGRPHVSTETCVSVMYRSTDGRIVVVVSGRLINHRRTFIPAHGDFDNYSMIRRKDGECEVRYFSRLSDAEAFWVGCDAIYGSKAA